MRTVLIGEDNPHSKDPRHALAPYPQGCSGHRLWKMLHDVSGATRQEYMDRFVRKNLDQIDAGVLHGSLKEGTTVVLLGEKVRRAFGIPKKFLHPTQFGGVTYRQVPHPSGRVLFYNDPACRRLVGLMLKELMQ